MSQHDQLVVLYMSSLDRPKLKLCAGILMSCQGCTLSEWGHANGLPISTVLVTARQKEAANCFALPEYLYLLQDSSRYEASTT